MGDSGPEEAVKGIVEDVKGKAKEVIGIVADKDDLREEGRAQQDKADAARDVAKKEAEAEAARTAEQAAEARQKAAE
ncbi:microaggregate-binding protein 1 [Mycolicibacterium rhodesiae]|uniref:CsbD family protein n=1 Tax=Mycolicibacterium rhodesiae TaxID=36814 RepID=A0A1X0IPX3_MYCRH|nr:CsbD family protein [Mycolicibacterium rhodesiae]MCV7346278.1 CsbD family protein [Mycolicibacterium rhodesiae]ORB49962.1 CsbD family protein [Mycolicibacterium rhodesiae]